MKRYIRSSTSFKRIARVDEFDNGRVLHSWQEMTDDEAEELAKQASLKYPGKIFYVQYDDIMNPSSDIKWVNGQPYYTYDEALRASKSQKLI